MTSLGRSMTVVALAAAPVLAQEPAPPGAALDRDQVRAVVAEIMADAESHSSLLAGEATAGHDGKFFIASPDGSYRLNIGGDIQFRYVLNYRGNNNTVAGPNRGDDFDPGFQNTRMRLHFDGNIVDKTWTYRILTRIDAAGMVIVEEAFSGHDLGNGWKLTWGQFKLPLLHEELVSSVKQLATERSITNLAFTQLRSQGVQIGYEQPDWNAKVSFNDGLASENTDFTHQGLIAATAAGAPFIIAGEADYAFTGRFEYKFAGTWNQYADFTSSPSDDTMAVLGVAAHFQQGPDTSTLADIDRQTFEYTADLAFKKAGLNLYGAFIGRHDEFRGAGAANQVNFDDFGALIQGGYRWGDTELFARWDAVFPDSSRNLSKNGYHFLTVGLNEYFAGHAAKFTADAIIALQATNDIASVPGSAPGAGSIKGLPSTAQGLLGSSKSGEIAVRLQFQLLF